MRFNNRGFTLINLIVSIAIIAVLAGVVVVTLEPNERARVLGATQMLASDLEYAQALSLAEPSDPVVVRFDAVNNGYWLERVSTPDTPIMRPNGTPYLIVFGQADAAPYAGVDLAISSGATNGRMEFDGFGRLVELTDAVLALAIADDTMELTASSTTGFVEIAWAQAEIQGDAGGGIILAEPPSGKKLR